METETEFCLLGPLTVRRGGKIVLVPSGKQRAVLTALLLAAEQAVSVDELAEVLWGPCPPPSARVTVRNYVKRLRKVLGSTGCPILTLPHGYLIQASAGQLDLTRFTAHLAAARSAAQQGRWAAAGEEARAGLALWRGEPLADVSSDLLAMRDAPRLAEMRLQALQTRIDADLHLGRHGDVIPELRQLTMAHPLCERVHAQLMLSLYRDGRQAEALAAYQHARQVLIDELGAEPGAALHELHQQILTADPALTAPEPDRQPASHRAMAVPRELPARTAGFMGRTAELAELTRLLDKSTASTPAAIMISAIGGTAGVGKTALAVQWANRVADRFPDGQLYVNLHGYDPDRPMPLADVLAGFLRALGVSGQDIPPGQDERAARYRSLLADKKLLIVLDNARSVEQVRPLLPGSATCAVIVTSRDALTGLVARDGATRLELDVLPVQDALALLRALIGHRTAGDPGATAELARHCCRLPLALRVAAELAAVRPDMPLEGLVAELADHQRRLDLLDAGGDPRTAVRAVFSWSYRHLDEESALAFRLAGLHPGPDFDPYAVAALIGASLGQAQTVLDALARAHLIQPASPGRYAMHDLLNAYACELAVAEEDENHRRAALTRLFDHYLHTAAKAMDTLVPAKHRLRPRIPETVIPVPPLADPAAAKEWLDGERAALVAAVEHTAVHGWPRHTTQLVAILARYLRNGGHYPEARTIFGHALSTARRTGDHAAEAAALSEIGHSDWEQGRFHQAANQYRQALALFRTAGDRAGQARALSTLGLADTHLGRYEQASRHLQEALTIYCDIGDRLGEAMTLGFFGMVGIRQGRYQETIRYYQRSLDLVREIGDRDGEAWALARLGVVDLRLGRHQHAAGYLKQALAMFQDIGNRGGKAEILVRLGEVYVGLGLYELAAGNLEQALGVFREIGDRGMETEALNSLGNVRLQTGHASKARTHHSGALRLASEADSPLEQARAHRGLGQACHADGDPDQASRHWQQSLILFTKLGAPEADQVRAEMATIEPDRQVSRSQAP